MTDFDMIIDNLSREVRSAMVEASAKIAEALVYESDHNEYRQGYNAACARIAGEIRRLLKP